MKKKLVLLLSLFGCMSLLPAAHRPCPELPIELVWHVLKFADDVSLISASEVSKVWREMAQASLNYRVNALLLDSHNSASVALRKAVLLNMRLTVIELVDRGANVNSRLGKNKTAPLFIAAQDGNLPLVRCLVRHGAIVNTRNKKGKSPLLVAASNGHADVVKYLLSYGAFIDGNDEDGKTPLFIAAHNGYMDIVECLIQCGANNNIRIYNLPTPCSIAMQNGHTDVANYLKGVELQYVCKVAGTLAGFYSVIYYFLISHYI